MANFVNFIFKNVIKSDAEIEQLPSEIAALAPWPVLKKRTCAKLMEDAKKSSISKTLVLLNKLTLFPKKDDSFSLLYFRSLLASI